MMNNCTFLMDCVGHPCRSVLASKGAPEADRVQLPSSDEREVAQTEAHTHGGTL